MQRPASLVIGIGNPLRGDDGVAWTLLDDVEVRRDVEVTRTDWGGTDGSAEVVLSRVHQLTPELAADLAACSRVLFVDAWLADQQGPPTGGTRPRLQELDPGAPSAGLSHHLGPTELLALCQACYGRSPQAHQLLVPAFRFEHGVELSPSLKAGLPMARRLLLRWLHA